MREFSVSDAISQGWELAKKHGLLLAVMCLVFTFIKEGIGALVAPQVDLQVLMDAIKEHDVQKILAYNVSSTASSIVSFIQGLLEMLFDAGIISTTLMLAKGVMTSVSFDGFKISGIVYLKYVGVELICGILVAIGLLACIIPGIFLAIKLDFASRYILDNHEAGIGEAMTASWDMTKGNFWNVFVMELVNLLIFILGLLCCCIGVFFAVPLTEFIKTSAYYTLRGVNIQNAPEYV